MSNRNEEQDSLCCDRPQFVYLGRLGRTEWLQCESCGTDIPSHEVPSNLYDQALNS